MSSSSSRSSHLAAPAPARAGDPGVDAGWPLELVEDEATIVIYQPLRSTGTRARPATPVANQPRKSARPRNVYADRDGNVSGGGRRR